jgi:hypothetical protein
MVGVVGSSPIVPTKFATPDFWQSQWSSKLDLFGISEGCIGSMEAQSGFHFCCLAFLLPTIPSSLSSFISFNAATVISSVWCCCACLPDLLLHDFLQRRSSPQVALTYCYEVNLNSSSLDSPNPDHYSGGATLPARRLHYRRACRVPSMLMKVHQHTIETTGVHRQLGV